MTVLPNGQMGQLYFGKKLRDREDFSFLLETASRPMSSCAFDTDKRFSLEHIRQEYGVFGSTDYRSPAVEVVQANGSRISDFQFQSYEIRQGKPVLEGLPATYTEEEDEAQTLPGPSGQRLRVDSVFRSVGQRTLSAQTYSGAGHSVRGEHERPFLPQS